MDLESDEIENSPDIYHEKKVYFESYDSIPLQKLLKMSFLERVLAITTILNVLGIIIIFYLITFVGITYNSVYPNINIQQWRQSLYIAYNLSWALICLTIIQIIFRSFFRKLTKIPSLLDSHLQKKQIYGDQQFIESSPKTTEEIHEKTTKILYRSSPLRDQRSYYFICVILICLIIGFLNYFPRNFQLFPSFMKLTNNSGFITKPSEYTTFYMINAVFTIIIFMFNFFLFLFSIRQIKDLNGVIKNKVLDKENNEKIHQESWKPPLPKPWNMMTLAEQKEYDMKIIQLEKERVKDRARLNIAKKLKEEKDLERLGKKGYKAQKALENKKIQKEKEKQEEAKQKDKFDFR